MFAGDRYEVGIATYEAVQEGSNRVPRHGGGGQVDVGVPCGDARAARIYCEGSRRTGRRWHFERPKVDRTQGLGLRPEPVVAEAQVSAPQQSLKRLDIGGRLRRIIRNDEDYAQGWR